MSDGRFREGFVCLERHGLTFDAWQYFTQLGELAELARMVPVRETVEIYRKRRDTLVNGLKRVGWEIEKPKGTMFVWGEIPEPFKKMGSVDFTKLLLKEGKVAVSPGIGFGESGEGYVRFALVENENRIKQAVKGIGKVLK